MTTRDVEFKGIEFPDALGAIEYAEASGLCVPITAQGRFFVAEQAECDRLAAMKVSFAYLTVHDKSDQVVTVPVN